MRAKSSVVVIHFGRQNMFHTLFTEFEYISKHAHYLIFDRHFAWLTIRVFLNWSSLSRLDFRCPPVAIVPSPLLVKRLFIHHGRSNIFLRSLFAYGLNVFIL
jgi:hypothetical protein